MNNEEMYNVQLTMYKQCNRDLCFVQTDDNLSRCSIYKSAAETGSSPGQVATCPYKYNTILISRKFSPVETRRGVSVRMHYKLKSKLTA
ncbi:MAG: hypothetical protein FMNOHCHN_03069 [Ignavibacteriaceae bacterium]|nr:hypothetical protein [Ignavibacteriaceae bacterium]